MNIEIATLDLGDHIAEIMKLANHRDTDWSSSRIDKYIRKEGHDILVAIMNDPVGYAGVNAFGDTKIREKLGETLSNFGQLTWLGVLPEYQKQGVARLLITKTEEWYRQKGKNGFWLGCRENLLQFYEHVELRLIGQFDENGKMRYIMGKTW